VSARKREAVAKTRDTKQALRGGARAPDEPVSFLSGSDLDWLWWTTPPLEERPDDGSAAIGAFHRNRTKRSTETKQKRARNHFSREWLERAHRENPTLGAGRLAQRARVMLADKQDEARKGLKIEPKKLARILKREAKKRDEITEDRARTFLRAIRTNSGAM
jgi:hypothetical protein